MRSITEEEGVMVGFPIALQLWVFEAIPALLGRLGGDDKEKLMGYVGEKLPQHSGLGLTDVLDAEHDLKVRCCIRVRTLA
ncbi:hypothetical protein Bca101_022645 [Brassica carinata]